jgi:hypothetical protein
MLHPLSSTTIQASSENQGIELAELGQSTTLQSHATAVDSLRSPPIASHLHLIDNVPAHPNAEFMTSLMNHLNNRLVPHGEIRSALMQWSTRHRNLFMRLGYGVSIGSGSFGALMTTQVIRLAVQMRLSNSYDEFQDLQVELRRATIITGALLGSFMLSFLSTMLFEHATNPGRDPFLNGPDVIDQNIVDPNELNNQPQNVHAASINRTQVAAFRALQSAIAHPVSKTQAKERILQVFDYLCEDLSSDFKREMIALNQANASTDAENLQSVKNKVENAIDFMVGDAQADRTPMHYPSTVTTSTVLTYVWSAIEQLSMTGHEAQARLLTENLIKSLYAAQGLCNTGHVSRVLQAFGDTVHFGFQQEGATEETPPIITPQDFYTLNQNDLNVLLSDVVNTHNIRVELHELEQTHANDRTAYKEAATLVVKEAFVGQLGQYLAANHALILRGNPEIQSGLMRFLETDFAAFIDNARNEDDMQSVASFSPT